MVNVNKAVVLFFLLIYFLGGLGVSAQATYILLNKEKDVKVNSSKEKAFYLKPQIDASYFSYDKKQKINKISFEKIKDKLITKEELNDRFFKLLKNRARMFEDSTGLSGNFITKPPHNYEYYMDSLYIYEPINKTYGEAYFVRWLYAIE